MIKLFLQIQTDSLTYETEAKDLFEDFTKIKAKFDCSNYSIDSKFCDSTNKLIIGKMNDVDKGVRNFSVFES